MHNLLPENLKIAMAREYRLRLVIVAIACFGVCGVIFFISLLPAYVISSTKESLVNQRFDTVHATALSKSDPATLKTLADAKAKLALIEKFGDKLPVSLIIDKVLFAQSSEIKITGLSFTEEKGTSRNVTISGIASPRQALLSFSKKLEKEKTFTAISLPVSNFQKNKDIEFALTLVANTASSTSTTP